MAKPSPSQIEHEFAQLPTKAQISLLERLVHQIRMAVNGQRDDWEADLSAMAADPDVQRELREIDAEFRATETDRLGSD